MKPLENMDQLMADPGQYGFCTFDEFRKNPDRWRPDPLQLFKSVEGAGNQFKKNIKKLKFEIEGYACDTLEKIQDVCRNMGYAEKDLTCMFFVDPLGGGMANVLVRFFHKSTVERREAW